MKRNPDEAPSTEPGDSLPGTKKHIVIPDGQVKPGVSLKHWSYVGNYIAEKHPDFIHNMGDFADMPSLSSYDKGTKSFEGRRYNNDIETTKEAMALLMSPIQKEQQRLKEKGIEWNPKFKLYLGNHEDRIARAVNLDAKLEGTIGISDLGYKEFGWEVYPYLRVVVSQGIAFSHYFTSGLLGRPVSSARVLVQKKHMSCIMGHVQVKATHTEYRADGKKITGMFSGICYTHDEDYLGPQGNQVERGIWVLHNVKDGQFFELYVPLDYLNHKYT
jgi:hypothetical protein